MSKIPPWKVLWNHHGSQRLAIKFYADVEKGWKSKTYFVTRVHLEHLLHEINVDLIFADFPKYEIVACLEQIRARVFTELRGEGRGDMVDYFQDKELAYLTETSSSNTGLQRIHISRSFNRSTKRWYAALRFSYCENGKVHTRARGLVHRSPREVLEGLLVHRYRTSGIPLPTTKQREHAIRLIQEYIDTQLG